jgi:hypothetical protein
MYCTKCRAGLPEGAKFCGSCGAPAGGEGAKSQPLFGVGPTQSDKLTGRDFVTFQRMITPAIIQVLFWIGVVGSIVGGITTIATGGGAGVAGGIVMLILGPIWVRVLCEVLIVVFRINENLTDIKHNTERK